MGRKEELGKIVGKKNVIDDDAILEKYARDESFARPVKPYLIVKPGNVDEIQQVVKWANTNLTPLVPISSGQPHFRGDTVPTVGGAVVVDMERMDKVLSIDRMNRIATIEPGVTLGKLQTEVEKKGMRLNMPFLPRSSKSAIGSMLEREPVIMPKYHWDPGDPMICTEIVFGTGDLFRTGSAAGPGTVDDLKNAGVAFSDSTGPFQIDYARLFQAAQGTMGIVTWASVRCELLPKLEEPFFVGSSKSESLIELIHWLVRLNLANECLVLNSACLAHALSTNWPDEYEILRDSLPPWVLFFCIAGYDYYPEERVSYQSEQAMDIVARCGLEPAKALSGISAGEFLKMLRRPSDDPYWKIRGKGSCHDVFFQTSSKKCSELTAIMKDTVNKYGYPVQDMGIYLQPIVQGTSYHQEFNLFYDPSNARETDRVRQLSDKASKKLMDNGAFFSRPYGSCAAVAYQRDAETTIALRKIKGIFDENNVMNPGKLCF